jgi:outer membrane protein OmpA-like peptidoglycan-associated protein
LNGGCGKIGCGILGLLGLLLLLFSLLRGCSEQMERSQGPRVIHDTVYVDEKSKEDIIKRFKDTTTISKTEAIELPNVQFYTNSAKLLSYSFSSIQQLADYMVAHPNVHATIIGHTDNVGDAAANLSLSQARAETVKQVLQNFGVQDGRVDALGKGETEPRTTNDTVEGRALNRRFEVRLTNTEQTETKSTEVNE